jgi:hypothetical protein
MGLRERVARLEQRHPATCQTSFHRIAIRESREPEPAPCPACGQMPQVIEVVRPEGV